MNNSNSLSWKALSTLLDELLDLDAGPRAQRLALLATKDPALAKEAERLLAQHAAIRADGFLEGGAHLLPVAGRSIGGYTLERPIGEGGMGSVWLARRSDALYEVQVAVKLLNLAALGRDATHLSREAGVLAKLAHPNITYLMDAGVDGGQPYLVLEYVQGEPIDRWCDARRLDIKARIRLFLDVLEAVSHAHGRMILHRDLKPSNVLVTADGTVKLLDFGIAKLLEGAGQAASPSDLTKLQGAPLTPDYAAPEQMLRAELTTATDVYALGVMLYVLLTGQHPTADECCTPLEWMQAVVEREPTRPSEVVTKVNPESARARRTSALQLTRALRGDLDNILCKALKKAPGERYATVEAFAADLRRYLNHEPVSARPDSRTYRLRKLVRRHRLAVGAVSATFLSLVAGIIGTTWMAIEVRRQREEATAQRDEARHYSRRADAANEFLNVLLQSDGGPDKAPLTGADRLNLGVEILEKQYREDPSFSGRMLVQLGRQFRGAADTRRAVEIFARAYEIGQNAGDIELMVLARCTSAYAEALAETNEHGSAALVEAQALMARAVKLSAGVRVDCLQAQAQNAHKTGDSPTAIAKLLQAKSVLEETGNAHRASYTSVLTDLGGIYLTTGRLIEALQMADLVGATHELYGRGATAARLVARQNRAVTLSSLGEIRAAFTERVEINRRARELEPQRATLLAYPVNYANLLVRLERAEEALPVLTAATEEARRRGNQFWLKQTLVSTAAAQLQLGRIAEAATALKEAQQLAEQDPPASEARLTVDRMAVLLDLARHDTVSARKRIEGALLALGYPQAKPVRITDDLLVTAADVAQAEARYRDAEEYARAALSASESVARGTETSADVGESLLRLADALIAQRRHAEATPLLLRAERCFNNGFGSDHPLTRRARDLARTSGAGAENGETIVKR